MKKALAVNLSFVCLILMIVPSGSAYYSYGARAMGMGGAFSAVADDATAVYWNPAAIGLIKGWTVSMDFTQDEIAAGDVQESFANAFAINPDDLSDSSAETLEKNLNRLDGFSWIHKGGDRFGIVIANKNIAYSISGYDILYVQPAIDTENVSLDVNDPSYIGNNKSMVDLSGFQIKEYGIAFGWISSSGNAAMGINGKYMDIKAYSGLINLWDLPSTRVSDLLDDVDQGDSWTDSIWNIDASIMFLAPNNRFTISGRNMISKKIEVSDDAFFKIKPEYRIGYAFIPTAKVVFAIDYALVQDRDPYGDKLDGKDLAMGFESRIGEKQNFAIRGGASMDINGGDSPLIFSFGAGLYFTHLRLDASYSLDQDNESHRVSGGLSIIF